MFLLSIETDSFDFSDLISLLCEVSTLINSTPQLSSPFLTIFPHLPDSLRSFFASS